MSKPGTGMIRSNVKVRFITLMATLAIVTTSLCVAQDKPSGLRIVTTQTPTPTTGSYGVVSASRPSGVAPLVVHFSTDFTGDPDQGRGFHTYDYTWDFGDPASGVWGTDGKSKNRAKGGIAAHVFEAPGNYNVSLTIRNQESIVAVKYFVIYVDDPDEFYAGNKTVYVNPAGDTEFPGFPASAIRKSTNNLSEITQYATAGSRILLKRGCTWTTPGLTNWPKNSGPVTIGAYGIGINPDAQGIYSNAPRINVTSGTFLPLDDKQNWRIMDLAFTAPVDTSQAAIGGGLNIQQNLFLRLKTNGFISPIGWTHWNNRILMTIDQMAIVSCEIADAGSTSVYIGGERLAFIGNKIYNNNDSHVVRVWQAFKSCISNNMISGSSLVSGTGRHALKLHGPGNSTFGGGYNEYGTPVPDTGLLANRTELTIVSDNIFGSSGPWPVMITPQDGLFDSSISNIIFERNRIVSDYGAQSSSRVSIPLHISGQYITIRNNIFDGTGSSSNYTGIYVDLYGREPAPLRVEIYNNTIYLPYEFTGSYLTGIEVGANAERTELRNNLVVIQSSPEGLRLIQDNGISTIKTNNLLNGTVSFIDPSNVSPLLRSFALTGDSSGAINKGYAVYSVFEDFIGNLRPNGTAYEIGAYEYY